MADQTLLRPLDHFFDAASSSGSALFGPQYKHKTVLATEDVRTVPDRAVPACARPARYREQRPVILAPGVVAR